MTEASDNRGERAPRLGVDFPLAAFEGRILADPDVLGMVYTGSLGRGGRDRWSDLDLTLWVRDEVHLTPELLAHYTGWLGETQLTTWSRHERGISNNCFVGPDWQRVELDIRHLHDTSPHPYWHRTRVVKDTEGLLAAMVAASGPLTTEFTRDAARLAIIEAIYYTRYVTVHNVRGFHYHAMVNLCELAGNLYSLLANTRGHEGFNVRDAERFLSADELALLYAAWPVAPEREAVRRAARGLWEWTRYVWAACEQVLGEELGIEVDPTTILEVIERPYASARDETNGS
jgi:hypothetical protein